MSSRKAFASIECLNNKIEDGFWPIRAVLNEVPDWLKQLANSLSNPHGVGYSFVTPSIVEKLCAAYLGEIAWDSFHDPNAFNEYLLDPATLPPHVFFEKSRNKP
jgi:hypothetical protein